jgi:hypothetical protein
MAIARFQLAFVDAARDVKGDEDVRPPLTGGANSTGASWLLVFSLMPEAGGDGGGLASIGEVTVMSMKVGPGN